MLTQINETCCAGRLGGLRAAALTRPTDDFVGWVGQFVPYLLLCTWILPEIASAQEAHGASPGVQVVRSDTPLTIDGHLTESMWQRAAVIAPLTQAEPNEGTQPTERTRVYLLYDADTLYIGVRAYDSEPQRIVARERQRDNELDGDDYIAIAVDPFHARKHGYYSICK
ncbi:MAG: hypothetical protein ACT4QB_16790 [Gammaproteobacteria bacterium]